MTGYGVVVARTLREGVAPVRIWVSRKNMKEKELSKMNEIRKIEKAVNAKLFLICSLTTFLLMGTIAIEFFTRGNFPPSQMNIFYVGVLLIYSLHKEMLRWMGEKEKERKGEWFLYAWIIFAVSLSFINFITKGYFSFSEEGHPLNTLAEVHTTALEVGAVFLSTRFSKMLRFCFKRKRGL